MNRVLATDARSQRYARGLQLAWWMMDSCEGLEPSSALRQAATDAGIPEGDELEYFVAWGLQRMGL